MSDYVAERINLMEQIIGTDINKRGMKSLIVPGDLYKACLALASLPPQSTVAILSGFPCCVKYDPPTETDGPQGSFAIARVCLAMGHSVFIVTDDCNRSVFVAIRGRLNWPYPCNLDRLQIVSFSSTLSESDEIELDMLARKCQMLVACERPGPAKDGSCYTMRGINMTALGLITPIHRLVTEYKIPLIAIGDGGNELGMGKVYDRIVDNDVIANGDLIGCNIPADYLIAASVSNWGGHALAAGTAMLCAQKECERDAEVLSRYGLSLKGNIRQWAELSMTPLEEEESMLSTCVGAGARDGVTGWREYTVDGLHLGDYLLCIDLIHKASLLDDLSITDVDMWLRDYVEDSG
jgi:D-glutamate cyclase